MDVKEFDTVERLDTLLHSKGMSFVELAEKSGVHPSTYYSTRRRHGQYSIFTIEQACQALGIELYEFFNGSNEQIDETSDESEQQTICSNNSETICELSPQNTSANIQGFSIWDAEFVTLYY